MAPTILELSPFRNSFDQQVFTNTYTNTFFSSATEIDLFAVRKGDYNKILFHMRSIDSNTDNINFAFYGTNEGQVTDSDDASGTSPPDFSLFNYTPLENGTIQVLDGESGSRILTDNWMWILVRAYLTSGDPSQNIELEVRAQ